MRFDRSFDLPAMLAGVLLLGAATVPLAGCSSKPINKPVVTPLRSVTIVPHRDTIAVNGTRLFVATTVDTHGVVVSGVPIAWSSGSTAVATVSGSGLATGVGEGTTIVVAASGGRADTAFVTVYGLATGWVSQLSNTAQNLNGVVVLADGHTGFAVGDNGTLVVTHDAGAHWSVQTVDASGNDLAAVTFASSTNGWIVGKAGTVLKTTDAGASWARVTSLTASQNLNGVRFVDPMHGWIVGASGLVASTIDGGASWTRTFPTAQSLNAVAFSDTLDGWVAGGSGALYGTRDGGRSWYQVQPTLTTQAFKGLARPHAETGVAVGTAGTVAIASPTADSLAWALGNVGGSRLLNAVAMVGDSLGFAVGSSTNALVLRTDDGGQTWTAQAPGIAQVLNGVCFVDRRLGWAVGAAGQILHTSSGGTP